MNSKKEAVQPNLPKQQKTKTNIGMNIFRLSRPLRGRVFLSPLVSRLSTMRPHSLSEGVSGLRPYLHSKHIPSLSECAL